MTSKDKLFLFASGVVFIAHLSLSNTANASTCKPQEKMTNEQWYNVSKGYYAAYDHGYGLTLAAIIIQESQGGLYRVNPESKDYGLTQINIKTAINRLGYKDTPFMRSVAASKIVFDDDLAIALAIEELLYWDDRRDGQWNHVVASYNSGNNMSKGLKYYYPRVAKLVGKLKGCFK
jgi:hypothetical protein